MKAKETTASSASAKTTTTTTPSIFPKMNAYFVVLLFSLLIAIVFPTQFSSSNGGNDRTTQFSTMASSRSGGGGGIARRSHMKESMAPPMMESMASPMMAASMDSGAPANRNHQQHQKHPNPPNPPTAADERSSTDTRMLVYRGTVSLQANRERLQTLGDAAKEFVVSVGGYVQSANSAVGYKDHRSGEMLNAKVQIQLRIPSSTFRTTMIYLRQLAAGDQDVLSESESVNDVTEQYVDQHARASALDGTHKALLKLLEQAHNTKDVLAVRRELRQVVQELESRKSRMKSLKSQSDFSFVSFNVNQRPLEEVDATDPGLSWSPRESLDKALKLLAIGGVWFGDKCVMTGVFAVPISVVVFVVQRFLPCKVRADRDANEMA